MLLPTLSYLALGPDPSCTACLGIRLARAVLRCRPPFVSIYNQSTRRRCTLPQSRSVFDLSNVPLRSHVRHSGVLTHSVPDLARVPGGIGRNLTGCTALRSSAAEPCRVCTSCRRTGAIVRVSVRIGTFLNLSEYRFRRSRRLLARSLALLGGQSVMSLAFGHRHSGGHEST